MISQYWRLRVCPPDGQSAGLAEVYFLDSSLTDLTVSVGGTATDYTGSNILVDRAFDRDNATIYTAPSSQPGYVGYYFSSPVDVAFVDITTTSTASQLPSIEALYLETSTNSVSWSVSAKLSLSSGSWAMSQTCRFTLTPISESGSVLSAISGRSEPTELNTIIFQAFRAGSICGFSSVNVEDYGYYKIHGYAKIYPDVSTKAKIILFDQLSNRTVAQTFSNGSTGYFEFPNIRDGLFYVVAQDPAGIYNGEIFTDLQPIRMN